MPRTQERSRMVKPKRQHESSQRVSRKKRDGKPDSRAEELARTRMGVDFSQGTFERHAALLGDARMSQPMYARQRSEIMRQIQRNYGNQYVQRLVDHIGRSRSEMVQTKLEVGPAGDKYEQEADRVAKEVVGNLPSPGQQAPQRQVEEEELQMKAQRQVEEEELQMLPIQRQDDLDDEELMMKPVQRQVEEEELQMLPIQRQVEEEELQMLPIQRQVEEEELQMLPIQRQVEEEELQMKAQRQFEEEELQMKPVQRTIGAEGGAVDTEMEGAIEGAKGSGQPLPDSLRSPMENAFGSDFSGVRVHDDNKSDALNQSISARAFTTGQDIFFKQGQYNPGSRSGQEVLAHELTHVIQQKGDEIQRVTTPANLDKASKRPRQRIVGRRRTRKS